MRTSFSLLTIIAVSCVSPGYAGELQAGVAREELTPPAELNAALGGYGARMSKPAQGVHDRVYVKALVVTDGAQRRYAVITADILGFPPTFKPALVQQLASDGWTSDQIMLLPSHAHTSLEMNAINSANVFGIKQIGVFDPRLLEWTIEKCVAATRAAASGVQRVTIGTAACELDGWNRNRRVAGGPVDRSLTVTRIDLQDGKPLAALVNFTAHPTFLGSEHMLFSGGWPGYLQRGLERMIGDDITVLYYNGAEGDQSPVDQAQSGDDRWQAAEQYGVRLAGQAHELWSTITPQRDILFDYSLQAIALPARRWHPDFMETGGKEYGLSEQLLTQALPLLFPSKSVTGSLRLGDLLIVGVPGEMTAELGLDLKQRVRATTGASCVTIGGLANEWISYILSADQYQAGGYEASVSFYGPELGQCIISGAAACAASLKQK